MGNIIAYTLGVINYLKNSFSVYLFIMRQVSHSHSMIQINQEHNQDPEARAWGIPKENKQNRTDKQKKFYALNSKQQKRYELCVS